MSKKYVIEIKPEYEDTTRGIMVLGAKDSNLYMDAIAVEDMEELTSDYINEHFGDLQEEAYQRGLKDGRNEAWEAVRKIVLNPDKGGASLQDLCAIFGNNASMPHICRSYSASEVIEKFKAYEEKQKADDKIEVGDTVNLKDGSRDNDGIVTKSWDNDRYFIMWADGAGGVWDKEYIVKTGRHFDIQKILEEMKK